MAADASKPPLSSAEIAADLVRREDPDRAVSLAFAPADRREALTALYAFNIETARVRDQISQPLPGEIRLQWWRDTLEAAAAAEGASSGGHPVAEALTQAMRTHALPFAAFDRFLEQRIFDLYDDPMPSRADFEAYAGGTASTLITLACLILDESAARQASDAAGHAGVAQLAAGVLRLLPIHRRRGQVFIPADILEASGCTREALLAGDAAPSARAVQAMVAYARGHVAAYRAASAALPATLRPAFLPAELTPIYLDRIEARGAGDENASAAIGPFRRSWTYWRAMRRARAVI
ncbi:MULTISPECIES: phytoene/squalene synthase family protein [unclassified Aureimonas]|uniref:phytoene/squalene synthase family protein n=1 Tax=unclassified Aureimonas TaxID=2615206 RepID=UPI0006F9246C|nr:MULTISPECIES: phytoene/squalene synthase family protein [unclassified Aureimonas]KQT60517.1 phytoene synthase [Aureimonas sp. Leaf427]KQT79394.1 phytoene synthase [Aureimonas sp. Leaf460]